MANKTNENVMTDTGTPIDRYYGLTILVEANNTCPQGDPDQDNRPRTNPVTGHGIITQAGLKRKIRDILGIAGHHIYVERGSIMEELNDDMSRKLGLLSTLRESCKGKGKGKKRPSNEDIRKFYLGLAGEYIDVRMFGQLITHLQAPMRGPVQMTDGVTIAPVDVMEMAITRCSITTEKDSESQEGDNRTMGRRQIITHGLYRFDVLVNPHDAARIEFRQDDYELLLWAIKSCFQNDSSSARIMSLAGLYEVSFPMRNKDGNLLPAPVQQALKQIRIDPKIKRPLSFNDYEVSFGVLEEANLKGDCTFKDLLADSVFHTKVA